MCARRQVRALPSSSVSVQVLEELLQPAGSVVFVEARTAGDGGGRRTPHVLPELAYGLRIRAELLLYRPKAAVGSKTGQARTPLRGPFGEFCLAVWLHFLLETVGFRKFRARVFGLQLSLAAPRPSSHT